MGCIDGCFSANVPHGKLAYVIEQYREAMRHQGPTAFSPVVDLDFVHHTEAAADYLIEFVRAAREKTKVAAVYLEMNRFDINPDRWFFSGFFYEREGDLWELDWLAYWDAETDSDFDLTGMEAMQEAFAAHEHGAEEQSLYLEIAKELATYLITCRYMELIAAAHLVAAKKDRSLRGLPVLATAHDLDTVHRTEGRAKREGR